MNNIKNKIINNILEINFISMFLFILLNFVLYLFDIRFRFWFICLAITTFLILLIIGILRYTIKRKKIKMILIPIIIIFYFILYGIVYISFVAISTLFFPNLFGDEYTVKLDDKKYVAIVKSFHHVDAYYYDYYGPFLRGTKVRVHGDFGKGSYNPYFYSNIPKDAVFIYYDKYERAIVEKKVEFRKDKNGEIINFTIYENDLIKVDNDNTNNDNYILLEDEEVLYEKKFGDNILRFGKIMNTLGGKMLVNVIISKDNGYTFYEVSEDDISVSRESKFILLNENIGFILSTDEIMYVTVNGGKNFTKSVFDYDTNIINYMILSNLPYYDNNILKLDCLVNIKNNNNKGSHEQNVIFESYDNGLTWIMNIN